MANNPYVNKVELADGTPIMDISSSTVSPQSLMEGYTAFDASGAPIVGTARGGADDGYVWQDGDGYVHLSDQGGTQYVVSQLIAEEYDSTSTYDVGDYCSYNGGFYVCSTAISTAEAWNTNHWTQVTVADELAEITGKTYIEEPSTDGTSGQVLTTDGNGGRSWTTVQGGGGTSDYSALSNKPQINSVTLSGNKSLHDLGIASEADLADYGPNLLTGVTIAEGSGYNVNENATRSNSALNKTDWIPISAGDVIEVSGDVDSMVFGHVFQNSAGNTVTGAVYSNGYNRRFVVPPNTGRMSLTFSRTYASTFTARKVGKIRQDLIESEELSSPFVRHEIKPQISSVDGFTHCAFPSIAFFKGREIVAYRASMSHITPTDTSNWGGVELDVRNADGTWTHIGLLNTSNVSFNGELRDPHLTVSRDGNTLFLACFTTYRTSDAPSVDKHDNVLFTLNESLEITGSIVQENVSTVFWGNTLLTPSGYILQSSYLGNTVRVHKSTTVFNGTLSGMTFDTPIEIGTVTNLTETTLSYWNGMLVAFARCGSNSGRISYTNNLEGNSGWSTFTAPASGVSAHAPSMIPYCNTEYLPVLFAHEIDSSTRKCTFGYLTVSDNHAFTLAGYQYIDGSLPQGYGGYCGLAYFGGDEFSAVYYTESGKARDAIGAQTGLYYKRFNARVLLPSLSTTRLTKLSPVNTGTITYIGPGSNPTMESITCSECDGIVNVAARVYNITETAYNTWFQIPEGFRPRTRTAVMGYVILEGIAVSSMALTIATFCYINTDGTVEINYTRNKNATQTGFTGTYHL